jgi:hypothetical protein
MESARADDELAARQLSLVKALVAGSTPPAGIDPERVRVQALALVRKRARSVARHRPELAANLGAEFLPAFQRYAAADPTAPANTSSDAQRFARHVRKSRHSLLMRLFLPSSSTRPKLRDEADANADSDLRRRYVKQESRRSGCLQRSGTTRSLRAILAGQDDRSGS